MYKSIFFLLIAPVLLFAQDGTPDSDFSADGFQSVNFGAASEQGSAVVELPDGKLLLVGFSSDGLDSDVALARFNPDGTKDNTFGANGEFLIDYLNQYDYATGAVLQPDGKIVICGSTGSTQGNQNMMLMRINPDGSLDNSFNLDGIAVINEGPSFGQLYKVVLGTDGSIYACGNVDGGASSGDFAVVKTNNIGVEDISFSFDGVATTDFGGDERPFDIALQADGKVVVAGFTASALDNDGVVARYNTDGSLDNSFGTSGKVVVSWGDDELITSILLRAGGKILLGGMTQPSIGAKYQYALAQLSADGTLDNSFNSIGTAILLSGSGEDDNMLRVLEQPDGSLLLCGYSDVSGGDDELLVIRLDPTDLDFDPDFGTTGVANLTISDQDLQTNDAILQSDGKLLLVGRNIDGLTNLTGGFLARFITGITVGILDRGDDFVNPAIFPNPVTNGQLTLEYELIDNQEVTIRLLNLQGQEITTLLNASRMAGSHTETLDFPAMLSTGYYLLQLQTAGGTTAIKVLVQ